MSVDGLTKCPSCPRMFLTTTVFKFHLRTHAEAPAGPVAASSGSTGPPSSPGSPNTSGEVQKFESGGEESPEAGTTLKSGEKNDLSSSKKMVTGKPEKFKCEHCHKERLSSTILWSNLVFEKNAKRGGMLNLVPPS